MKMQNVSGKFKSVTTRSCFSTGTTVAEIGASYIHGPCEENPVFCLVRDYGLLHPEAPFVENHTMDVTEYPPWTVNWFTDSGAT